MLASHTKVLDGDARASVLSYSAKDGTITFARASAFAAGLAVGDVLASKTNPPAAPAGFLRRVTGIDTTGADVVVRTEQATLTQALSRARFATTQKITDPQKIAPARPGVTVAASRGALRTQTIPSDRGLHVHVDHLAIGADVDGTTTEQAQIIVDGDVALDVAFTFSVDLDLAGLHHLVASAEVDYDSSLQIDGHLSLGLSKEILAASAPLTPIDIQIGPFPLVLVPDLALKLGVDGNVALDVSFHQTTSSTNVVGARFDDGVWTNLTHSTSSGGIDGAPSVQASFQAEAYGKIEAALLLYDVAGPYAFMQAGLELDAQTPHRPFMTAGVHLKAGGGIKVQVTDALTLLDYELDAVDAFIPFWQSPNNPPILFVTSPGGDVTGGQSLAFTASAFDLEDGDAVRVTWTSDDGPLGEGTHFARTLPSPRPGPHVITITATDTDGAQTVAHATVNVVAQPVNVIVDAPSDGATLTAGQAYVLHGRATDPNVEGNPCVVPGGSIAWSSDVAGDAFDAPANPSACADVVARLVASPAHPVHTLTLRAIDAAGQSAAVSVQVNVPMPAAGDLAPVFTSPADGAIIAADSSGALSTPLRLDAALDGTPSGAVTYTWTATSYEADGRTVHATATIGTTSTASVTWQPNAAPGFISQVLAQSGNGQKIVVHVHVVDAAGNHGDRDLTIWLQEVPG